MQELHPIKHSETFPTALKHVEKLMLRDRLKTCFLLIYVQKEGKITCFVNTWYFLLSCVDFEAVKRSMHCSLCYSTFTVLMLSLEFLLFELFPQ